MLALVRNFVPAHEQVAAGRWDVAEVAKDSFDIEGKVVATVGVGRIGERVLRRLVPFNCKELLYFDYQPLNAQAEKEIGCRRVESLEDMLSQADIVTINCPLHEKTKGMFNKALISKMKKGAWLVNTARGAICVREGIANLLENDADLQMLLRLLNLASSVDMVVTCGSLNPLPKITLGAPCRTRAAPVETQWYPTCLVPLSMRKPDMPLVSRRSLRTTSAANPRLQVMSSLLTEIMPPSIALFRSHNLTDQGIRTTFQVNPSFR